MRRALVLLVLLLFPSPSATADGTTIATADALRRLLSANAPAPGTFGIHVVDARTGETVFEAAARTPRLPASTMKLFTTGTCWLLFGKEHRFATEVMAGGPPAGDGTLAGDLVVLGQGDPTLEISGGADDERALVDELATRIARSGVKCVVGNLVLDDSWFDRELRHPSWPANQLHKWYCAAVSALTVARSCVTVQVRPGALPGAPAEVSVRPASGAFRLESSITTTARKSEHRIRVDLKVGNRSLKASGKIWIKSAGYDAEVAVPDPTLFFGHVLHRALVRAGVSVRGEVIATRGAAAALEDRKLLARVETPLLHILEITNRRSQNLFAECLLKSLGKVKAGEGSFAAGSSVTGELVSRLGVPMEEFRQADGSGLSRENQVTPRAMTSLLVRVFGSADPATFLKTLPAGGAENGSLRKRMADLGGNVRAKTGTIRGVSCLAGYVRSKSERFYAFAVFVNDPRMATARARNLQDGVCRILRREE